MKERNLEFYIDESGNFIDDAPENAHYPEEMSLVGGILYDPIHLNDAHVAELLPEKVHCCEEYKKIYINVLEKLYSEGSRFIIFENKERIKVINGDITYLNIIAEGLVQLLSDLPLEYPAEKIKVHIVVATRKAVSRGTGIIQFNEYRNRLEEKILIALHRSKAVTCDYTLDFVDARASKRHDFADIVCNTYMTRKRRKKFSDEERKRIEAIYDQRYIYPVFEDATVGYLKQLLSESRFSEMIYQICTLAKLQGVTDLRNKLLVRICKSNSLERKAYFSYISLQLGLYNERRMYSEGIRFAENYKQYILIPLRPHIEISNQELDYWFFDTDFYILTMYDHMGNATMCGKYLEECNKNIYAINRSWEHIDYYFKFRIRELNCLMGRFDFNAVIRKADNLIGIFSNAKELFSLIETYDGTINALQSELLGKVYGVKLEAYINLIPQRRDLFEDALIASDRALAEFSNPIDIRRQYQYRCSLMLAAGKNREALECLMMSYDLDLIDEYVFNKFIDLAYSRHSVADAFALWHYTSVMVAMGKAKCEIGAAMRKALTESKKFEQDLKDTVKSGYPWNMVLWNISKWCRLTGSISAADGYYQRALAITKSSTEQVTLYSFSLCMMADYYLWALNKNKLSLDNVKKEVSKAIKEFDKLDIPESMRTHFSTCDTEDLVPSLLNLSNAYLK